MPNVPTNAWQGAAEGLMNVNQMFNERKQSDQRQQQIDMENKKVSMEMDRYDKEQKALDSPMTLQALMGPKVSPDSEFYKGTEKIFKDNKLMNDQGFTTIRQIKQYTDIKGYQEIMTSGRDNRLKDIGMKQADIRDQMEKLEGKDDKKEELEKLTKQLNDLESEKGKVWGSTEKGLEANIKFMQEQLKEKGKDTRAAQHDKTLEKVGAGHDAARRDAAKNKENKPDSPDVERKKEAVDAVNKDYPNAKGSVRADLLKKSFDGKLPSREDLTRDIKRTLMKKYKSFSDSDNKAGKYDSAVQYLRDSVGASDDLIREGIKDWAGKK